MSTLEKQNDNLEEIPTQFRKHFYMPDEENSADEHENLVDTGMQTENNTSCEPLELFNVNEKSNDKGEKSYQITTTFWPLLLFKQSISRKTGTREERVREFFDMLLKYIGAAVMVSQYLKANPLVKNMSFTGKTMRLIGPSLFGYVLGRFITPVYILMMSADGMQKQISRIAKGKEPI